MITHHYEIEQGTTDWHNVRRGVLTSSAVKTLITPTGKLADNEKVRAKVYEVAAERLTGRSEFSYQSFDMMRGHFEEIRARDLYGGAVQCGFITHEVDGVTIGFSPDGLIGEDGLIEIKSAKARIQVERLAAGIVPPEHIAQIQTGLLVSGRAWCDFISFGNGMPMMVVRVLANVAYHALIVEAAKRFEAQVAVVIAAYTEHSNGCKVAEYMEEITDEINTIQ